MVVVFPLVLQIKEGKIKLREGMEINSILTILTRRDLEMYLLALESLLGRRIHLKNQKTNTKGRRSILEHLVC